MRRYWMFGSFYWGECAMAAAVLVAGLCCGIVAAGQIASGRAGQAVPLLIVTGAGAGAGIVLRRLPFCATLAEDGTLSFWTLCGPRRVYIYGITEIRWRKPSSVHAPGWGPEKFEIRMEDRRLAIHAWPGRFGPLASDLKSLKPSIILDLPEELW